MAVMLVVLFVGFGAALYLWPRDRITAESYEQIRVGMTEKDVEDILGGPGKKPPFTSNGIFVRRGVAETFSFWIGRNGFIEIEFDNDRRVIDKYFHKVQSSDPISIDRLRDWLGW
jgi:hypothetical protein